MHFQKTLDGEFIEPAKMKLPNGLILASFSDHWKTPASFYKILDQEFHFDFDPCPFQDPPEFDGLLVEWGKSNFVNPPYSDWQAWIFKAYEELQKGKTSVFLLASRTDTVAFHEIILPYANEIRFVRGRLKFSDSKQSAPFASMVVIFKP